MDNKQQYNILYSGDQHYDLINLFTYMDSFAKNIGFNRFDISAGACQSVLSGMKQDFPHKDGLHKASPFKKISNFITNFIVAQPIKSEFPDTLVINGHKLNEIKNHQNAIIAFHIAVDSLENAIIYGKDDTKIELKNKIIVSEHTYFDIIDTLSNVRPIDHFKIVTLLFEQLAYRFNEDASYPPVI
jgi:hypothetical protein